MADAVYRVTATRPEDPKWNDRRRDVQQYELRVERLDERFGKRLGRALHEQATRRRQVARHQRRSRAGLAIGRRACWPILTPPDRMPRPQDAAHPIRTREALQTYDPDLYALVNETMAYDGRVDWRFRAAKPLGCGDRTNRCSSKTTSPSCDFNSKAFELRDPHRPIGNG